MVHRRYPEDGAGGLRPRQRHHGHPSLRLRDLGAHPRGAQRPLQGDGSQECLFPHVHPVELSDEGGGARGGFRARGRARHPCRQHGAGGKARRASDVRDHHLRHVFQVGAELSRSASPHQPVGKRRPLGEDHASLPSHQRVPVAGGSHPARHRGRSARRDAQNAGSLPRVYAERACDRRSDGHQRRRRKNSRERWRPTPWRR